MGLQGIIALGLVVAALAAAQTPASSESFDELARRAESLLDSRPAEAAAVYKQALGMRPEWAEGWLYLGAALYQLDRYAEATDAFRKGVALAPRMGNAWAFLGLCEAELDDPEQALADIRKGEGLGLGDNRQFEVAVRVKAAQLLIRSSAFDEALGQLQPLAKSNENSRPVQETMGLCALALPSAISELSPQKRAVVELAGKAAWASASQHPAEAAAAYKELMDRYANEPGAHYAYGLYLMETDLNAALAEFEKEAKANPKHWPALVVIGSLRIRQGDADPALESLEKAMKVMPARYRWLCHAELGRARMISGKLDMAANEFETAARLMPGNAQVHYYLSQVYRRLGRKADAQKETVEFEKLKAQQDPLGVPEMRPFTFSGGK